MSIAGAFWFCVAPAGAQQSPAADHVFVNGALAVPGALDSDTVPAKFSQKNAADDEVITLGYTFKLLSAEQRRAIYEALRGKPPVAAAGKAEIGTVLPSSLELSAVPNDVAAKAPQTSGYRYAVAGDRVLLVSPSAGVVTGVLDGK
jgi:Protein of unknown function (DUF1236)